ncbi:MAG: type II secretion system ATPase GspE [Armatimonadota bacterium]|nr:type II secretion system ATPase GspE [Armatimonadota bacterium]MDR7514222.1 type II secretion system ATPase GspE [Armatimonadota bacterium]MDR7564755.1 type II secretion system ATPase GspE [Armatimonadota bacterium]MDR7590473.1 type II secretion system ATPase GspE [Armatimonadota bacterium]
MKASGTKAEQAEAELAALREYKASLGIPAGNQTLECAWRYHQAIRHAHAGRLQEAIAEYKKLIELAPEEPVHYLDLADLYQSGGFMKEAAVVLLALGEVYERLGLSQEAVSVLERAEALEARADGHPAPARGLDAQPSPATGEPGPAPEPAEEQHGEAAPIVGEVPPRPEAAQAPFEAAAALEHLAQGQAETAQRSSAEVPARETFERPVQHEPGAPPSAASLPVPDPAASTPPAPPSGPRAAARPGAPTLVRREALGGILVRMGLLNEAQLQQALEIQARTGERLGRILVRMGLIAEEDLAKAIGVQWGYPYVSLSNTPVDPEVVRLVPQHIASRHKVLAFGRNGDRLLVALVDPLNLLALDDVRLVTGMDVEARITTEDELMQAINKYYHVGSIFDQAVVTEEEAAAEEEVSIDRLREMVDEAPVVKLVNVILDQAIREGASDIHIEPHRNGLHVRYRIDGVLHDVMSPPKNLKAALVSRIKIVANLDIAERRRPQDGRIHLKVDGRDIDLRVSTLPTMFGEKVVMRILDQSNALISLNRLGMASDVQAQWEELASKPYGMILVTGPTGSGKTTTLYATLSKINTLDKNIITVEDPVEYQLPRINQVQVNPKAGLTFATGLRSILRQDPDVIMVGEIRDRETAEIAVQAALTGHLVLSTLHTNDAPSAFTRLVDMGIEPFLITSSVIGVLAQRLARTICPKCKEAYRPPREAVRRLSEELAEEKDLVLYRGAGCDFCRQTGYKGRTGVYELLVVSDRIRERVVRRASANEIREVARSEGFRTMRDDGIRKVLEGVTTIEEILRVVYVTEGA